MVASIENILEWFSQRGNSVKASSAGTTVIVGPRAIEEGTRENISFVSSKYADVLSATIESSNCGCIILDQQFEDQVDFTKHENTAFVISSNPKKDLIDFCSAFFDFNAQNTSSDIHSSANIHSTATIGKNVHIGANTVIEENVIIGDFVSIGANNVIKANSVFENNVEVGACNTIGGTGFGYGKNEEGEYEQFPHYGKVILKEGVHVGNNTCIDRGSLSDTVLSEGVKVDNQVHIAHNVKIGKNSLVIAQAMIAGSVIIGENCWIAPSSCIRNGVTIGDNVTIGLAATVTKSVEDNATVMGSPAMPIEEFIRLRKHLSNQLKG